MTGFLVTTLVFCGQMLAAEDPSTRHISKEPVSELELQIIEHGDDYSVGVVLGRLEVLYKVKGIDAVRPAIPAMKTRLEELQAKDNNSELESDLVVFLGRLGDTSPGSKRLYLNAIERGQRLAAFGLVGFDSSIVDSVAVYLQHEKIKIRGTAIGALVHMYRSKPDLFTKVQTDSLRQTFLRNLEKYEYKGSDLFALGTFGDSNSLPVLKAIAESDTLKVFGDTYTNRRRAQWAIDQINSRGH